MNKDYFSKSYVFFRHTYPYLIASLLLLVILLGGCGDPDGNLPLDETVSGGSISGENKKITKEMKPTEKVNTDEMLSSDQKRGKISVSRDEKTIYVHGWVNVYELSDRRTKKAKKIVFCKDAGIIVDWDSDIGYVPRLHDAPLVEAVEVEKGNISLYEKDGMLIQRAGTGFNADSSTETETLMLCAPRRKGEVRIPEGVQCIIDGAFIGCADVTSVVLPSSVEAVGDAAFGDMKSCTNIQVNENNRVYYSKDGVLYGYHPSSVIAYPSGKTDRIYDAAPGEARQIGAGAFLGARHLQEVHLPSLIRVIQRGAFQRCKNLRKAVVKNKKRISDLSGDAFDDCPKLREHVKDKYDL